MTREIKASFFDIDGTLVSFNTHEIPPSTIQAIHDIRQRGIKVFISTGRPQPFINNLGSLEYDGIISTNGAYCTTTEGEVIYRRAVPKKDISRIISETKRHHMPIVFATDKLAFLCNSHTEAPKVKEVFDLLNLDIPKQQPFEKALEEDILQIIAFFTKEEEDYIMTKILRGCNAERWHPSFADCICKGNNKATGIEAICAHYGFNRSEVIAFGDGGNDISMLQYAGIGIAMGNASPEVKAIADMVTNSVDEDGIANALTRLLPTAHS